MLNNNLKNSPSRTIFHYNSLSGISCIYIIVALETTASAMIVPISPVANQLLAIDSTTMGLISSLSLLVVILCGVAQGWAADTDIYI